MALEGNDLDFRLLSDQNNLKCSYPLNTTDKGISSFNFKLEAESNDSLAREDVKLCEDSMLQISEQQTF